MKNSGMPLVSINVPTYNSEKTISETLKSIKAQSHKNIETIMIDSHSTDKTVEIAKKFGVKVVFYDGTLLGARDVGVRNSKGKYILLLDSDQILDSTTVERGVKMLESGEYDMLWLYERSWKPKKLLEILYDADRELVQKNWREFIYPIGGVILPRFYRKEILSKAFSNIPPKILPLCVAHDHAIIYYEANKLSKKIGEINNAVWHMEPWSWTNLFKKTYRYGITTRKLVENKVYPELLRSKNKGRKIKCKDLKLSLQSNLLRLVRAIPYLYGYFTGKNKKIPGL